MAENGTDSGASETGARRTVVIVATLDTKGAEAAFVRDEIAAWGLDTVLIDPGVLGSPSVAADISREEVARAAGTTLEALLAQGKKGVAIASQTEGLCRIVQDLYAQGRLHGIVGIGGGQGTSIGTAAMRSLPIGVPKLMLSTIASGRFQFGPYVGTKDICMMHSVTDILGLNVISRPILRNAANAIAGMALRVQPAGEQDADARPAIAITMLGITTPCVMRIKARLEAAGYEVVPFHANGTSGPAMEKLIEEGRFQAVIDLSTHEVIDNLYGGLAGAPNRLEALTRCAIPAVVSVGGSDYLLFETLQKAPPEYQGRPHMVHNAQMTCLAPTPAEMVAAAQEMIGRLNRAQGPMIFVLPQKGFSDPNQEGRELWVPEGNRAVLAAFQAGLRPDIPIVAVDLHLNDPAFAGLVAACMEGLLQGEAPQDVAAARPGSGLSGRPGERRRFRAGAPRDVPHRSRGDRAPLFEMSVHGALKAAVLGRPVAGLGDEVDFWRAAGYDFVSIRAGARSVVRGYHPAVRAWREQRAGHGKQSATGSWVTEGDALIHDRGEFEEFPWPAPEALGGYPEYESLPAHLDALARLLPPGMKLLVQLGYVFMGAWQMMGFENFCLKLSDEPDLVAGVIDRLGALQLGVLETLLQYDCVGTVWLPDDLCYNSGPMVSPRVYRKYVYPWYVRMVERCHAANVPVGLHSDGDLARLLPDLVRCGFDAIHPFEPPINDIAAVKREWGHRIAVAGNIDLKGTLERGTPADVEAEVRAKAALLAPGGGWLIASSNSIPEWVPSRQLPGFARGGPEIRRAEGIFTTKDRRNEGTRSLRISLWSLCSLVLCGEGSIHTSASTFARRRYVWQSRSHRTDAEPGVRPHPDRRARPCPELRGAGGAREYPGDHRPGGGVPPRRDAADEGRGRAVLRRVCGPHRTDHESLDPIALSPAA